MEGCLQGGRLFCIFSKLACRLFLEKHLTRCRYQNRYKRSNPNCSLTKNFSAATGCFFFCYLLIWSKRGYLTLFNRTISTSPAMNKLESQYDAWDEPSTKHWGIDISSNKIEGVIIDEANPSNVLCRMRIPTGRFCGYDHIIDQTQLLVGKLEEAAGIKRPSEIGICTPGIIHPSTRILKTSSTLCLNGHHIERDLSAALNTQVILSNDANCFALGEALFGTARTYNTVIGIIIDTGVGTGIVIQKRLLQGLHGIAGEWGHNTMYGEEVPCHCGKKGCNEMVFSEPALEHFYENITGIERSLPEIHKCAKQGEAAALKTLERLQEKFAEAIANLINILDPEAIIIGGSVGNINLLYAESTRSKISPYICNKELKTLFLKPALGDSAGAFGAAMLNSIATKKQFKY